MIMDKIKKIISKGYLINKEEASCVEYISQHDGGVRWGDKKSIENISSNLFKNCFCFILPTYVGSNEPNKQVEQMIHIFDRVNEVAENFDHVPIILFIAFQFTEGHSEVAKKIMEQFFKQQKQCRSNLKLIGFINKGSRKKINLNIAISFVQNFNLSGIGWVDDDVYLEPKCLVYLVEKFIKMPSPCAVGAKKIAASYTGWHSRVLKKIKLLTQPAMNYPHGCCILVSPEVIIKGIPNRYCSEDGYICFELISPNEKDPFYRLCIVPESICHHYVGAKTLKETLQKIRRLLLNHIIFMADYPKEVSIYYFQFSLFYGLWPLSPWSTKLSLTKRLLAWPIKMIHFSWFVITGLEVIIRAMINRPVSINWRQREL